MPLISGALRTTGRGGLRWGRGAEQTSPRHPALPLDGGGPAHEREGRLGWRALTPRRERVALVLRPP